jgi:hypothetical protein
LVKSDIIEAFDEYFEEAEDKEKIIEFVKRQLGCDSPKTRKAAARFLASHLRRKVERAKKP